MNSYSRRLKDIRRPRRHISRRGCTCWHRNSLWPSLSRKGYISNFYETCLRSESSIKRKSRSTSNREGIHGTASRPEWKQFRSLTRPHS